MLFASHPRPVREAIDALRRQFDEDPVGALERRRRGWTTWSQGPSSGTGGSLDDVALTDSTTMGLSWSAAASGWAPVTRS
jgi:hypothetical protein